MSWELEIKDEKGNIAEVRGSFYIGGIHKAEPSTGFPIVGSCEVNVTYNYRRLLREAGMRDALDSLHGRTIDPILVAELIITEGRLEQMCVGREPSGDYWNGNDSYNALKLVRWLREASEELGARGGNFTFKVY